MAAREGEAEPGPGGLVPFGPDPPTVGLDDPAGDREPEPVSLDLALGGPGAVEAIEHAAEVLGRDARSLVGDRGGPVVALAACLDPHAAGGRRVLDGVPRQV